ncbi:MAG TPA: TcpE family conjugal transfer membrane protein [Solirubrobacterales bacterium]|nr:TcpE family conjugal transfer membrane protein [Solirubrobacterales bacterium]
MSQGYEPIRSYQRIFRPERRIYAIEGRPLPVPGGVPLRWAAWAAGALVAVIALGSGSGAVELLLTAIAAAFGFRAGGRVGAALAAAGALGAAWLLGLALGLLDWPLRLIVIPAAVATLATQATPDGRRADRFALSWLSLRLAPRRRSLGRPLAAAGRPHRLGGELWVAPDERSPQLRRSRVRGPALVFFSAPVSVRRSGLRGRRVLARPAGRHPSRRQAVRRLRLGEREALEVRP